MSPPPPPDAPLITPPPTPEEAAAIVAALHRHRRPAPAEESVAVGRWRQAARQAAVRGDWSAARAAGWRGALARR
jgi:hypothetical protein